MTEPQDDETVPQRRRPLLAGTGWLVFVCAFLPTLRVCGSPVAPFQFPPDYVVYVGAAILAVIATLRAVKTRRAWFAAWFVLWFATAITWLAMFLADASPGGAMFLIGCGVVGAVLVGIRFWRLKHTPRGMWIGAIIHGVISIAWYMLLTLDPDAMWGASVGLVAAFSFTLASYLALARHMAERRALEPAALPAARVVAR